MGKVLLRLEVVRHHEIDLLQDSKLLHAVEGKDL